MKYCISVLSIFLLLLSFFPGGAWAQCGDYPVWPGPCMSPGYPYPDRIALQGVGGEGLGHDNRLVSGELFFAPYSDCFLRQLFLDIKGHYLQHNRGAANVGLGARYINDRNDMAWGVNVYYDFRNGHCAGNFNQVGAGFEALSCRGDFRMNVYFPIGNRAQFSKFSTQNFQGGFMAKCRKLEYSMNGFDAEIGVPLFCCGLFRFYTALGTYYYQRHQDHFWGGSARVCAQYSDHFIAEVKTTYDRRFQSKVQALLTINVPFEDFSGGCLLFSDCYRNLLFQLPYRHDIIVTRSTCCWKTNF